MKLTSYIFLLLLFIKSQEGCCSKIPFLCDEGTHTVSVWEQDETHPMGALKTRAIQGKLSLAPNGEVTGQNEAVLGRWMGSLSSRNGPTLYNNHVYQPEVALADQKCAFLPQDFEDSIPTSHLYIGAHLNPIDWNLHEKNTSIVLQNGILWDLKVAFKQDKGTQKYKLSVYAKNPLLNSWNEDEVSLMENNNILNSENSLTTFDVPFQKVPGLFPSYVFKTVRIKFKDFDPLWSAQINLSMNLTTFGSRPFDLSVTRDGQAQIHTLEYKAPYLEAIRGDGSKERVFHAVGATYHP